jgi:rRNA-processing protein FCF1
MPAASRSPLDDTDRLIVDGTNMLRRLGPTAPASTIVGRIRAAVPLTIAIELVFDGVGHGVSGRLAQAMHVRYSGRRTADEAILELVGDVATGPGPLVAARTLVVTDDRALRIALTARGARTAGVVWLLGRMQVPALAIPTGRRSTSIGSGRPPVLLGTTGTGAGSGKDEADERPGWKPGRGATAKTGTPKRVARHHRHPRQP